MAEDSDLLPPTLDVPDGDHQLLLPSGRRIALRIDGDREELVLTGQDGAVQLQLRLTDDGPVLSLPQARISLTDAKELSLSAQRVDISGTESLQLRGGEVQVQATDRCEVQATGPLDLKSSTQFQALAPMIWLN